MSNSTYRQRLLDEREWRSAAKARILNRIKNKKTFKSKMQALDVIAKHNIELTKIDKILKDHVAWS